MSSDNENQVQVTEEEKKILLDHDYDGIKELNNPLPFWWVAIFALTVAFSIPYYVYYVHFGGPSSDQELEEKVALIQKNQADFEAKQGGFDIEYYNSFTVTPKAKKMAKKTFKRKCKACHGAEGQGGIGPNLTDNYWIHGNKVSDVYKVIDKGVVEKGMQAWGQTLGKDKMMAVTKYVMELKGTNPPNPKEPQGELYE